MYLYSVEGVGPRNVPPIKTLIPSILIGFPYLPANICICIPLCTRFAQTGYIISTFTYTIQTEREWKANISNLIFLPGIVELLLTVGYYKVFSPVNDTWRIVVMLSLVIWSVRVHAFRGRGFGRRLQGGWDVRFQWYQAKVSIFQDLLLHL